MEWAERVEVIIITKETPPVGMVERGTYRKEGAQKPKPAGKKYVD